LKGTTLPNTSNLLIIALKRYQDKHYTQKTLGFVHPTTKEMMRFDTELPQDFQDCIENERLL
jgi:23S rRNA pseudouridine1911/1915/1917 synthase